jgi:D-alanyl-lipoteichoic acid acyltransferase DltB (MBOAT superfamily)
MLFNSYEFIFLFLPLTLAVFFLIGARSHLGAAAWLALSSLFFYGWWNPKYVLLLLLSAAFNFVCGGYLSALADKGNRERARTVLITAVTANLVLLGYYKYANFFAENVQKIVAFDLDFGTVLLPLGISFFTFTQIAFLVDAFRGEVREYRFTHYLLFVTYFPHLIAGPVLHHKEMMPQFKQAETYQPRMENFAIGLTIFAIGLFKKVVLADGISQYADSAFDLADTGSTPTLFYAWGGALAYTLQLYFDFSGYSDMAIGLSRLFGVQLPLNFFSPYKAASISDFWRRWHMTLSRFLRDYLYISLGGSRKGNIRRYLNLMITMVLGGLWHGAGWTFVVWGALHGFYLVVNHGWQAVRRSIGLSRPSTWWTLGLARTLTFLSVVVGWVFFRATTLDGALRMLDGMIGRNGLDLPVAIGNILLPGVDLQGLGIQLVQASGSLFLLTWVWIGALLLVVFFMPNTTELMRRFRPAKDYPPRNVDLGPREMCGVLVWGLSRRWAILGAILFTASVLSLSRASEFLYYQF